MCNIAVHYQSNTMFVCRFMESDSTNLWIILASTLQLLLHRA